MSPDGRKPALLLTWCVAALASCGAGSPADRSSPDSSSADGSQPPDAATDGGPDARPLSDAPAETETGASPDAVGPIWRSLFNGVDFAGWDRYLGKPTDSDPPLGINNDPLGVFTLVTLEGEPVLHISGQVWGALVSQGEFCNFHLRGQYRWGTQVWPPLNVLDSGIMYLSTGPFGAVNAGGNALSDPIGSGGFMVSMEYQLTPVDSGGMYNLGPIAFAPLTRFGAVELTGAWNQVEIIVAADMATHRLNQQDIAVGGQFRLTWPNQPTTPLRCGKLQIQSEGGEIFFRRLEIQALP